MGAVSNYAGFSKVPSDMEIKPLLVNPLRYSFCFHVEFSAIQNPLMSVGITRYNCSSTSLNFQLLSAT
jgi:hypothetical protein